MSKFSIRPEFKTINCLHPVHILAFGFGSGLAPKAPGTFGTLAAIPLFLILSLFSTPVYFAVTLFFMLIGPWICGYAARSLNVHDHPGIVWDEIVGLLIALFLFPPTWLNIVLGFALFRLFDILKPWPISWFDKNMHGGFGIMIDDVIAGFMAWFSLYLINHYLINLNLIVLT